MTTLPVTDRAQDETPVAPVRPARRVLSPRAGSLLAAVLGGLAGAVLFAVAHRGLPDDSYISMDYARTLVEHGRWGLTPFRDANAATSPLNVWVLAAGIVVTGRPVVAVGLELMASTALLATWGSTIAAMLGWRRWVLPTVLVGLLVTSPFFTSTVGMEAFLGAALVVGVLRYAMAGRPVVAGVLTGLAALARPDLVVPAVVLLVVAFAVFAPRRWRALAGAVGLGALVALPWHVFAWFTLGGFLPDTFAIKTVGGSFADGETFGNAAPRMFERWPVSITLVFATMLVGLVAFGFAAAACARGSRALADRLTLAAGLAGLAHYVAYALLGVPSYLWYYCASIALVSLCAALGVARLVERGVGGAFAGIAVLAGLSAGVQIAAGVPWVSPVFYGNWALPAQYLAIGEDVARTLPPDGSVEAPGEIGVLAYGCRCDIVDAFSDHAWAVGLAQEREGNAGPVMRAVLRANRAGTDPGPAVRSPLTLHYDLGPGPGWRSDVPGRGVGHFWMTTTSLERP